MKALANWQELHSFAGLEIFLGEAADCYSPKECTSDFRSCKYAILTRECSKQHLLAIRMLVDWFVTGQVLARTTAECKLPRRV